MKLTPIARLSLSYLAKSREPLWGGHLKRGEPITDPEMRSWVANGLIKQFRDEGYFITEAGRAALLAGKE